MDYHEGEDKATLDNTKVRSESGKTYTLRQISQSVRDILTNQPDIVPPRIDFKGRNLRDDTLQKEMKDRYLNDIKTLQATLPTVVTDIKKTNFSPTEQFTLDDKSATFGCLSVPIYLAREGSIVGIGSQADNVGFMRQVREGRVEAASLIIPSTPLENQPYNNQVAIIRFLSPPSKENILPRSIAMASIDSFNKIQAANEPSTPSLNVVTDMG